MLLLIFNEYLHELRPGDSPIRCVIILAMTILLVVQIKTLDCHCGIYIMFPSVADAATSGLSLVATQHVSRLQQRTALSIFSHIRSIDTCMCQSNDPVIGRTIPLSL